jgi:hypothetical protein
MYFATRRDHDNPTEAHVSFPLVVTDGLLATAEMVDGEIDVKLVSYARFVLKWPVGNASAIVVDIVTREALRTWVRQWANAGSLLLPRLAQTPKPSPPQHLGHRPSWLKP